MLGGAAQPQRGVVHVKGGLGYLPQDPRLDGVPDDVTALNHVLSGRGFDEALDRMEKLRLRIEEDPSERNVERFSRAEERFRMDGGYAADSEVRRLAAGIGLADDRLELPARRARGGQRRRVELVRILFAGSDVLMLDEPTNHLDADAKTWMLDYIRSYQGALLVISHDLDLLDEAITRVLHLDRGGEGATGTMVEYKGTYSPVPGAAGARTRPAWPSRRPRRRRRSTACRPSSTASAPRPRRRRWPTASRSASPACSTTRPTRRRPAAP